LAIERVLLIRHGQTDWNIEGRWQGYEPVALNAEGWAQARLLAEALRDRPIRTIISSDLPRAFETATTIGQVVGVAPQVDELWREFNLGVFQGHTLDEIKIRFPQEWESYQANYWDHIIAKGESRSMLQARVYKAWESALRNSEGPEVVIVSHGGSIKLLLLKLFNDVVPDLEGAHFANTSVTTIERAENDWRLLDIGSVQHLSVEPAKGRGEN
jgi:broad specificity phosphatase PhoE